MLIVRISMIYLFLACIMAVNIILISHLQNRYIITNTWCAVHKQDPHVIK
jgi:hypothetical protein